MGFSQFHFLESAWLWGLVVIPAIILLYLIFQKSKNTDKLKRFADPHLLPHLVRNSTSNGTNLRAPFLLLLWSTIFALGVIAMAGPSWNYIEQQTYEPTRDMVIVLELSQTMNATDVKPSRIARAREEIEDLLNMSHNDSIGLIAYAAVPHMVTPLTDDFRTIRNLLPELDTSLVTIQGDRLAPALQMAAAMLKDDTGNDKSILVIGDGQFQETDIANLAHAAGNATIYTMGVGASNAGLQVRRLQALAAAGNGIYVEANYTDSDTRTILSRMGVANYRARVSAKNVRIWDNRFYLPALFMALLLLPLFRKGSSFLVALIVLTMLFPLRGAKAGVAADWFLNKNQQAKASFDSGNYKAAMTNFDAPYQRGVAAYRAKQYEQATLFFATAVRQNKRLVSLYNLGNAQLLQDQVRGAIVSYRAALQQSPNDVPTRHNLAIALKLLEQEQQNQQQNQNQNHQNQGGGDGQQNKSQQRQQGSQSPKNDKQSPSRNNDKSRQQNAQAQSDKNAAQKQGQQERNSESKSQIPASRSTASQPARSKNGNQNYPGNSQYGMVAARPRAQRDINADQWLTRVQNDPGSFLKNQFMIEDQKSGLGQGAVSQ